MKCKLTILYFLCVTALIIAILEYASAHLIRSAIKNELPIFKGILIDNKNVLTIKPNADYLWGHNNIQVRTNNDGYREDFDFQDQDLKIAFMGDSFCFGHGVNAEDRYSNVVARKLIENHIYPKNTIASLCYNNGFEIEHYEYFLKNHPQLKPEHLVINIYLGNDIEGDIKETELTRNSDGSIETLKLPWRYTNGNLFRNAADRYSWISWLKKNSNIARIIFYRINKSTFREILQDKNIPIPSGANSLETEMGQLGELELRPFESLVHIKRMMNERGTKLHVLVIPQNFIVGSDTNPHLSQKLHHRMTEIRESKGLIKATMQQCANRKLECHDLSAILQADDYLPYDGHWTVKGNKVVATYLENILGK